MPIFADPLASLLKSVRGGRQVVWMSLGLLWVVVLGIQIAYASRYLAADSFTYFAMARVFHDTGMLYSYTGLDHTTGIHPGYYFLLLPAYALFGLSLPLWSFVINGILLAIGVYVCYRAFGLTVASVCIVLISVSQGAASTNNGMESALLFCLLGIAALLIHRIDGILSARKALVLGVVLGAAVFARLDTIFFALLVPAFLAVKLFVQECSWNRVKGIVKMLAYMALPMVLWGASIAFLNYQYDGTIVPLSGKLKSSFPDMLPITFAAMWVLKVFAVALATSTAYLALKVFKRQSVGILIPALWCTTLMLFAYNVLFVSGVGAWYGTLAFFTLALSSGLLAQEFLQVLPRTKIVALASIAIVIAISVFAGASHLLRNEADWVQPHRQAVAYLKAHAQPGETAAEFKDGIGAFYSTTVPVYNLTGLGNNAEYANALRTANLTAYLKDKNIKFIISGAGSFIQVPGAAQDLRCTHPVFESAGIAKIYRTSDCVVVPMN